MACFGPEDTANWDNLKWATSEDEVKRTPKNNAILAQIEILEDLLREFENEHEMIKTISSKGRDERNTLKGREYQARVTVSYIKSKITELKRSM